MVKEKASRKKVKVAADASVVEMVTVMATVAGYRGNRDGKDGERGGDRKRNWKTVMITVAVTVENVMTVSFDDRKQGEKLLVNVPQELKNQLAS